MSESITESRNFKKRMTAILTLPISVIPENSPILFTQVLVIQDEKKEGDDLWNWTINTLKKVWSWDGRCIVWRDRQKVCTLRVGMDFLHSFIWQFFYRNSWNFAAKIRNLKCLIKNSSNQRRIWNWKAISSTDSLGNVFMQQLRLCRPGRCNLIYYYNLSF